MAIVPLVDEEEWLGLLNPLPVWHVPSKPILLVSPHPDDETLGAGGLIRGQYLCGCDVTVAAVTDGENAYPGTAGLGELRRVEQTDALAKLGVDADNIIRFALPDSNVVAKEQELTERLTDLTSQDTHIVAPWSGDFHPDHQACGRAAQQAARNKGASLTWYFFWTWHFGNPSTIAALDLLRFPLPPDLLRTKLEALSCHRSQLHWVTGDPILPERLLVPAKRSFEVFAAA